MCSKAWMFIGGKIEFARLAGEAIYFEFKVCLMLPLLDY